MKNNKKAIMSSLLALTMLVTAGSALAYQGDYTVEGPDCTPEKHEAMEQAFTSNDYDSWKELMNGKGRVTQVVNEDNFAKFAEAHQLAQEGRYDEADAIRRELRLRGKDGVKVGSGFGGGNSQGRGQGNGNRMNNNLDS